MPLTVGWDWDWDWDWGWDWGWGCGWGWGCDCGWISDKLEVDKELLIGTSWLAAAVARLGVVVTAA